MMSNDITMPLEQMWRAKKMSGLRAVLIENKMTFLTLPYALDTFSIWSRGFGVRELQQIDWLSSCSLFYWGDLDAHGFQILSALRSHFPSVIAFLMDDATFERYKIYCVDGTPIIKPSLLPNLTPQESDLYMYLAKNNLRLEQERIPHSEVVATFKKM